MPIPDVKNMKALQHVKKERSSICGDGNGTDMFLLYKQVRVVCFLSMAKSIIYKD
jgi:hypothetical protein